MKDSKSEILDDLSAKGDGMTVPEGYFEDFAVKMSGRLPFREELDLPLESQSQPRNTLWLRVRPYAYMAAMFAGAWCLIRMFTLMSATPSELDMNSYPALAHALQHDDQFIEDYIVDDISIYDLEEIYLESYMERNSLPDESEAVIINDDVDHTPQQD